MYSSSYVVLQVGRDRWPRFRDGFREQSNQGYTGVGIQHLLLPEPTRYITDRLVSVNIAILPVCSVVVQLNSRELLPALKERFPLDEFSIASFVPAACVRSSNTSTILRTCPPLSTTCMPMTRYQKKQLKLHHRPLLKPTQRRMVREDLATSSNGRSLVALVVNK